MYSDIDNSEKKRKKPGPLMYSDIDNTRKLCLFDVQWHG